MSEETLDGVGSRDRLSRPPAPLGSAAILLGVATAVGHAFSYAFSLVMSRALGPADFGALGALLGLAVVATVPATALQTEVARLAAVAPSRATVRHGYRLSWLIGAALGVAMTVFALPLVSLFRLDSVLSVLLLAVGLVPISVIAARQGLLLGRGAFGTLALVTVLVPALRLVGAVVAATADLGVAGALGMQAAATWVGLVAIVIMMPVLALRPSDTVTGRAAGTRLSGVLKAGSSLLGLFVLANADVLLARVFLGDAQSGIYAVGALGAKVVFWGSQFVALLVFPRVAKRQGGSRLVAGAGAMVAAVGGAAALVAIPLGGPLLDLLVGPAYADAAAVAPWFVVLGTLLSLVQLSTYAAVATERHRFSILLWVTIVGQSFAVALLARDVMDIVVICIIGTALLTVAGALLARRSRS